MQRSCNDASSVRQRRPSVTGAIIDTVKQVEKRAEEALVVLWADVSAWQQDNHYIHSGYRPQSDSFRKSFESLGYLHNESVNIWTHLLGAIFFSIIGAILYTTIRPRYESATQADVLAFGCFFLGAAVCLGMSAAYHAVCNHSPEVSRIGNKFDYVGIVFLITGSFIPSIYYGFYCHPHLQETYWIMICSLGLGCATVSIFDRFRSPAWRPYRAAMFTGMGLSAVFPVLHGLDIHGYVDMKSRMGLNWALLQGVLYILGAALYAARWPERTWPGSFDIWGSSHQIFHVFVVMAAASHLCGIVKAFDYRHGELGLQC